MMETSPLTSQIDIKDLEIPHTLENTLEPISAVHPQILDILKRSDPTLLLRISKGFYYDLIPQLYRRLNLNQYNIQGILKGVNYYRKKKALKYVRELSIMDIQALDGLLKIIDDLYDFQPQAEFEESNQPTLIFPNLDKLFISFKLLKSINNLTLYLSNQNMNLINNLNSTSIINENEIEIEKKLSKYSKIFNKLIKTKLIELEINNKEIKNDEYWSFDITILTLFEKIKNLNSNANTNTKFNLKINLSNELPLSKGYIPHNLILNSNIHFFLSENNFKTEELAKLIRDHYDVYLSSNFHPEILYFVKDPKSIKAEFTKMLQLLIRVGDELLLDEMNGGILRKEE